MGINNSNHIAPQLNETSEGAKPYLAAIVICTIYISSINLLSLVFQGFSIGDTPVYILELAVLFGVVQTLRNRAKGLLVLGITAKICFVILVFFNLVSFTILGQFGDSAYILVYFAALGFLAITDIIPALRQRAGIRPISFRGKMLRLAAFIIPLVFLFTAYAVTISSFVPREARELRSFPYKVLVDAYGLPQSAEYSWNEDYRIFLRQDLVKKETEGGETSVWTNNQGVRVFCSPGAMGAEVAYLESGFDSPYEFEKAVWNASVFQVLPLIIKAIAMPKTGTAVYHLETEQLNAIIIIGEMEDGRGHTEFHAHPEYGEPYSMNTLAPTLAEAVEPVILTVEKLINE